MTLYPGQNTLFSPCRQWRYFLRRPWQQQLDQGFAEPLLDDGTNRPPITFCLLNPSTADETKDDPTVARCRRFAVRWGFGDVIVLNAFAYRATDPKDMRAFVDAVGPDNDRVIVETIDWTLAQNGRVVCGWGNHGEHKGRGGILRQLLAGRPLLGFPPTKSGEPGHPLYLKNSVEPVPLSA